MANRETTATLRVDEEDEVSIASGESRFIVVSDVSSDEESEMTRYSVASKKQIKKLKKKEKRKHRKQSNRNNNSDEVRDPPPPTIMKFSPTVEDRRSNEYDYSPIKRNPNSRSRSSNNNSSKRSEKLKEIIEQTNNKPYVPRTITAHHILEDLHSVSAAGSFSKNSKLDSIKKDYLVSPAPKMKVNTFSAIAEITTPEKCPEYVNVPSNEKRTSPSKTTTPPKTPPMLDIKGLDLENVSNVIGSPFWKHINNASENRNFDFETIKYWTRAAANASTTARDLGASDIICKSVAVSVLNVSESLTPKDKESARKMRPYLAMAAEAASRAVVFNGGSQYVGAAVSASVLMSLNEILSLSVREDDDDSSVDYSVYSTSGLTATAKDFDVEVAYEEDDDDDLIEFHRVKSMTKYPDVEDTEENFTDEEHEHDLSHVNSPETEEDEMEDKGRSLYSATTFEADAEQQDDWSLGGDDNDRAAPKKTLKIKKGNPKKIFNRFKRCFNSKIKKNDDVQWI